MASLTMLALPVALNDLKNVRASAYAMDSIVSTASASSPMFWR